MRQSEEVLSKRQHGAASLMVWGAFAGNKKNDLAIVESNMIKDVYTDTLESDLLPFVDEEIGDSLKFMQDGAPANRALMTQQWFDEEEIHVMDWPAKSLDPNPIENCGGYWHDMFTPTRGSFRN